MFMAWEHSIINISILLKFIHRIRIIPTKISASFIFCGEEGEAIRQADPKTDTQWQGVQNSQSNLGKE